MNINVNLEEGVTSCAIDFEQSDVENMWYYLREDRDNFEYGILQYLNANFDIYRDEWKNNPDFEELYNNLKELFKE